MRSSLGGSRTAFALAGISLAAVMLNAPAASAQILNENFDSISSGLGYGVGPIAGTDFTVTAGSVDVLAASFFGLSDALFGQVVDLDGNEASTFSSPSLTLTAGNTYTVQYQLAGSQRGDTNSVSVFLGGVLLNTRTLDSADSFTTFTDILVAPASGPATLVFDSTPFGSDAVGLLLNDVVVNESVGGAVAPEPGTLALLGVFLPVAAGIARRRR